LNFSVRELESLRPRLRDGLRFTVQEQGAERVCVIEDPVSSRFFRVGFDEYRFFRSLDGSEPVAVLLARLARDSSGEGFSESEAMQMLRWLNDNHLLATESDRKTEDRTEAQRVFSRAATWLNPLVLRVPLARPDRFFARLAQLLRPVLGGFGFLVWLGVLLLAGSQLAVEWPRFRTGFEGILARDNWLWLLVVWVGLKVFHEFGHGVFCRHFGASVREIGAIFVLFLPMGYVDATASLGLASRWRRIAVACAGVYVELFIAAIAALFWAHTPNGPTATILHNAVVMGSVVTLFFNANPLMRFDGYYVLSDLAGLPNLATRARSWLSRTAGWLLLGAKSLRPERPHGARDWFIALYAVAAWLWQLLVFGGLLFGASALLRGGGVLFAVIAALLWASAPLLTIAREFSGWMRSGVGASRRFFVRGAVLLGLVATLLFTPYHKSVVAAGVVEFRDTRILRTECPGFADRILVHDGDLVEAGDLLVELRNDEATSEFAQARLELAAQRRRARYSYTRGEIADYQAEQSRVDSMAKVVQEKQAFVATLQIRAPIAGRVTSRTLERSTGAFFERGAEVLRIGDHRDREVKVAVGQDAEPHFRAAGASSSPAYVDVRVEGRDGDPFPGVLNHLDDQASHHPPHEALTASIGGPLPVRRVPAMREEAEHYELAEPYFEARVLLSVEGLPYLADGELARVKFRSPRSVTLFSEIQTAFTRWVRKYGGG